MSSLRTAGVTSGLEEAAHQATVNCFRTVDRNQDGLLSFDEFKRWYMQNMGTKVGSSGPASTPADRNFKLRVPRATYCYLCSTDGTGRRTHRSLNSIDPSIKGFYKDVFVAYELSLTDAGGRQWSVLKRYSSIHSFWTAFKKDTSYAVQAKFPPKVLGRVDVENRRNQLEWFLRTLFREPSIPQMASVQHFLHTSDAEMGQED